MAIEFQCPSCSAAVRVADQFAGRQGRCPRCAARVIVPNVIPPKNSADRVPPPTDGSPDHIRPEATGNSETSSGVRPLADVTTVSLQTGRYGTGSSNSVLPVVSPVASAPDSPIDVMMSAVGPSTAAGETGKSGRTIRRRKMKKNRQRVLMIGVPVVCFLGLIAFLAAILVNKLPELNGQLAAAQLTDPRLPPDALPWSSTGLAPDDQIALRSILKKHPETFSSALMTCLFTAEEESLQVRLKAESGQAWFMIDPRANEALIRWAGMHKPAIMQARSRELQSGIAAYFRDKQQQESGERVFLEAQRYRDEIGLNTTVDALGYVLEAVAKDRIVRCAREDEQGRLYFLLPTRTSAFLIRGRRLGDGSQPFAGEFQVSVSAEFVSEGPPAETSATAESDPESMTESSSPDSESGEKENVPNDDQMDAEAPKKLPGSVNKSEQQKSGN